MTGSLLYSRNWHNTVNQLYFKQNLKTKNKNQKKKHLIILVNLQQLKQWFTLCTGKTKPKQPIQISFNYLSYL